MQGGPPAPGDAVPERRITLGPTRVLTVRRSRPDDVDALVALYASLSPEDRYRRFFQAHPPSPRVAARLLDVWSRGGVGLVVELEEDGLERRLVAEASYEPLPAGGADLGITVARRARGWLGAYLLDVVIEEARRRGVTNLQADVLLENRPMLALARGRGYATLGHSECPSIVRIVMGTGERTPPWPSACRDERVRVLVEARGGRWPREEAARAAGLDVVVCPGPGTNRRCPAVAGRPCPLVRAADVVVDALPAETELGAELLDGHRSVHAATPLLVEQQRPRAAAPNAAEAAAEDAALVRLLRHVAGAREGATPPSSPGTP